MKTALERIEEVGNKATGFLALGASRWDLHLLAVCCSGVMKLARNGIGSHADHLEAAEGLEGTLEVIAEQISNGGEE